MDIRNLINIFNKKDLTQTEKPLFSFGEDLDEQAIGRELIDRLKAEARNAYDASIETIVKGFIRNKVQHELFTQDYGFEVYEETIKAMKVLKSNPPEGFKEYTDSGRYVLLDMLQTDVDEQYKHLCIDAYKGLKQTENIGEVWLCSEGKKEQGIAPVREIITPENFVEVNKIEHPSGLSHLSSTRVYELYNRDNKYDVLDLKVEFLVDFIYKSLGNVIPEQFKSPDFNIDSE